jgi:putative ATP-binding cassette transporter
VRSNALHFRFLPHLGDQRGIRQFVGHGAGADLVRLDVDGGLGERSLEVDPSGTGKSTLLRAIAGLWPFGHGRISLPSKARLMFMPQKNYLPDGLLKEALTYPLAAESVNDADCRQVLIDCHLPQLVDQLHDSERWGLRLSPGEQQRLAFARALLYQPDILFLDEASAALDNATEAHLYQLLVERLSNCTMVSVAHRTTLDVFHDKLLGLDPTAIQQKR